MKSYVKQDHITAAVASAFDFAFDGSTEFNPPQMPETPSKFGIGLIVGPSGSGKSTLLRRYGEEQSPTWESDKAVCSHFASVEDAVAKLGAAGLNSIPTWLRPFHQLSTGEQFRAWVARQLRTGGVIDEFTSLVDRTVAKSSSVALRRFVDTGAISNVVVASCHYDIIEWLQPDWTFDTRTGQLLTGRSERPVIHIRLVPCDTSEWSTFSKYHYLSGDINKSARCWVALWESRVVGFCAALAFPNGNFKNAWRGHRTVILPDFQGIGIGVRLSDAMGEMFTRSGCRYFSKTAHPRMGAYRDSSPLWKPTSKNRKARPDYEGSVGRKESAYVHKHINRKCWSHEYVGRS